MLLTLCATMATLVIGHSFKNGGVLTQLSNAYIRVENSQVDIDADGANGQVSPPPAYAPAGWGETLDNLGDAGHPGDWWALATDNGRPSGKPLEQTSGACMGA